MKIIRCDRCGREITQGETYWIIQANPTNQLGKSMFKQSGNDLCNDCGKELGEWFHPRKIRSQELYNWIMCGDGGVQFILKPKGKTFGWKAEGADGMLYGRYEKLEQIGTETVIEAFGRLYKDAVQTMKEVEYEYREEHTPEG